MLDFESHFQLLRPALACQSAAHQAPSGRSAQPQVGQIEKSLPETDKPTPIPDLRVLVTVDLLKFKPADLGRLLGHILGR
ncbi:MAG TPA: hypothetical protein VKH82_01160 [Candidatus Binatia bacterium]|nr:hypothetical protein [Candidatus Binatia bacterium]